MLADNGIDGEDVPPSVFLPEETSWLEESEVESALSSLSGAGETETSGIHGLGLLGTSLNGTELVADSTTAVAGEESAEVEVQVQNQGESTENGVTVTVTVSGSAPIEQAIPSIGSEETEAVAIPLPSVPSGEATIDVEVQAVPGEKVTSNNEATYTVEFE